MFERYTEKARRVIYFARCEASADGTFSIEAHHMLLAILREARHETGLADKAAAIQADIRKLFPEVREKIATSVDLPLSEECRHALTYAEGAGSESIGPEHLLLGLLREDNLASRILLKFAVTGIGPDETHRNAPPALRDALIRWSHLVRAAERQLRGMPESLLEHSREGRWARKEILGHLIDSASNNHQRFVRAQLEDELVFPRYEQESWSKIQGCQNRPWVDLVDLWASYNRHLVHIASRIPEEKLSRPVRLGGNAPVTLQFLVTDYVDHMEHHLRQLDPLAQHQP